MRATSSTTKPSSRTSRDLTARDASTTSAEVLMTTRGLRISWAKPRAISPSIRERSCRADLMLSCRMISSCRAMTLKPAVSSAISSFPRTGSWQSSFPAAMSRAPSLSWRRGLISLAGQHVPDPRREQGPEDEKAPEQHRARQPAPEGEQEGGGDEQRLDLAVFAARHGDPGNARRGCRRSSRVRG